MEHSRNGTLNRTSMEHSGNGTLSQAKMEHSIEDDDSTSMSSDRAHDSPCRKDPKDHHPCSSLCQQSSKDHLVNPTASSHLASPFQKSPTMPPKDDLVFHTASSHLTHASPCQEFPVMSPKDDLVNPAALSHPNLASPCRQTPVIQPKDEVVSPTASSHPNPASPCYQTPVMLSKDDQLYPPASHLLASPRRQATPYPSDPLVSPISRASHDPQLDSDQDSFILYLGCDSSEEEEELRNITESSKDQLVSALPSDLKFSSKFTLTPVHTGKEEKDVREFSDLVTPYQSISQGVDCPERPMKTHRTSLSHCESSTSCRLLFSTTAPPSTILEDDHHAATGKQLPASPSKDEVELSASTKQLLVLKDAVTLPISVRSPSSSSCSDCMACSTDSSSHSITSPYLSSPVLSQIKPTSQTIMSSPEEDHRGIEEVVAPLTTCALKEAPETSQGVRAEDMETQETVEGSNGMDSCGLKTQDVKEVLATAISVPQEASPALSSTGSTHSNWTVISGISPLPSSDPTHLQYYRRHHHHHHRHHHHHHHHHHRRRHQNGSHNKRHTSEVTANLVTSTPIHQRRVVETMDVSSVMSNQECLPETRFVMSSELASPESYTSTERSEGRHTQPQGTSSDKENVNPSQAPMMLPIRLDRLLSARESASLKRSREYLDEESSRNEESEEMEVNVKKTRSKGEGRLNADMTLQRNRNEEEVNVRRTRSKEKEGLNVQKKATLQSIVSKGRPMSRREIKEMAETSVNIPSEYLEFDPLSPRLSSTLDELVFRAATLDSQLSVSLE